MTAAAPIYPTVVPTPEAEVTILNEERGTLECEGTAIVVCDQTSLEVMVAHLKRVKAARKIVKEKLGPPVDTAYKLHKQLKAIFNEMDGPLAKLEGAGKLKISAHNRAEEQRRHLAQLAEEKRVREEQEAARLAEAEALEDLGEHEAAEEVISQPTMAPPKVEAARPQAKGSTVKITYKARVVNIAEIVRAAAAGNGNAMGLLIDPKVVAEVEKQACQLAKVLKEALDIPGVEVYDDRSVSIRS